MKTEVKVGLALAVVILLLVVLFVPYREVEAQVPTVTLEWTAPGDDGMVGTASTYEMRYSTAEPDTTDDAALAAWWAAATPVSGLPVPQVAGTRQSFTMSTGLAWATTYYFVMIACDDGLPPAGPTPTPNCSTWSNVASKTFGPEPDTTPPSRVFDLIAR